MDGACSKYGIGEKYIQGFGGEKNLVAKYSQTSLIRS
jgi:hypothetical protein